MSAVNYEKTAVYLSDNLRSLEYIDFSHKLSDLSKYYKTYLIYYFVKDRLWVVLDRFDDSYINYAIADIKENKMSLIIHENSMFTDEDLETLKAHKISAKSKYTIEYRLITTTQVNEFIKFLDNNKTWIKQVAYINNFISYTTDFRTTNCRGHNSPRE